jgi:hypothetical protein
VALAIFECPSKHCEADDVGMTGRVGKSSFAVDADQ